jgi:hypothetical protein
VINSVSQVNNIFYKVKDILVHYVNSAIMLEEYGHILIVDNQGTNVVDVEMDLNISQVTLLLPSFKP